LQQFIDPATPKDVKESLKQFLIMSRINPPMIKAWMLRDGALLEIDSLSEIGIYSCIFLDTANKDLYHPKDKA